MMELSWTEHAFSIFRLGPQSRDYTEKKRKEKRNLLYSILIAIQITMRKQKYNGRHMFKLGVRHCVVGVP